MIPIQGIHTTSTCGECGDWGSFELRDIEFFFQVLKHSTLTSFLLDLLAVRTEANPLTTIVNGKIN